MNLLKGAKTYLIGNLQDENESFALNWRDKFTNDVKDMGIITMSPLDKVYINFPYECKGFREELFDKINNGKIDEVHKIFKDIRRRDLSMVDSSQFIVCILNTKIPSYGTIEELAVACRSNKPVFIHLVPENSRIPLWLLGMFRPSCFYKSVEDIISELRKYDSGEKELDTKYWKIFEPQYLKY